ncbi:MAG: hypothetical protein KatS3mg082_3427 [Nitrospiraceae bacterium]|nr:MAG: hypothetical protein KatS3mg082_3427 [Nitrospiraceae bacterium]
MFSLVLCICTCDRPAGLERVLRAVDGLEWPEGEMPSFAVVVVDNLPDGRARDVVERLRPSFRWPLHFVEEPEPGWTVARNRAVAEALALGAEFVAFVDDDDLPRPDWLWWLWERQRETGADIVFGGREGIFEADRRPDGTRIQTVELRSVGALGFPEEAGDGNVMYKAHVFDVLYQVDGSWYTEEFRKSGGADTHLFARAVRSGLRWAAEPRARVVVAVPDSLRGEFRRMYRYGFSRTRLYAVMGVADEGVALLLPKLAKGLVRLLKLEGRERRRKALRTFAFNLGRVRGRLPGEIRHYR